MYGCCVSRKWARTVSAPLSCCLDVPTRDYAGTGLASTRAMRRTQPAAIGRRGRHVGHTGGISHNGYAVYNAVSKGVVRAVCSWSCISLHTPLVQHGCAELWNVIRFIEKKSAPLNTVWRKRFRLVALHFKKNKQEQSRAGLPVPDHARLCIFTPLPRPPPARHSTAPDVHRRHTEKTGPRLPERGSRAIEDCACPSPLSQRAADARRPSAATGALCFSFPTHKSRRLAPTPPLPARRALDLLTDGGPARSEKKKARADDRDEGGGVGRREAQNPLSPLLHSRRADDDDAADRADRGRGEGIGRGQPARTKEASELAFIPMDRRAPRRQQDNCPFS